MQRPEITVGRKSATVSRERQQRSVRYSDETYGVGAVNENLRGDLRLGQQPVTGAIYGTPTAGAHIDRRRELMMGDFSRHEVGCRSV
jgi:hypothetical protein